MVGEKMSYVETKVGSWNFQEEDYSKLYDTSQPLAYSSVNESDMPEIVDPSGWTVIENQSNQGACRGHSLSTCIEHLYVRQGGDVIQLSRACAYYETQRIDNIQGDRGSTIQGGCELAENIGICLESVWPYPSSYRPGRPSGWESSVKYKTQGHSPIRDAEEGLKHLAFAGPLDIGIIWGSEIDQQVGRNGIIENYTGSGGGGHAVCIGGYTNKDWNGQSLSELHFILYNSWSSRWGKDGKCLVKQSAFNSMCKHRYNVLVGHFGIHHPLIEKPSYV